MKGVVKLRFKDVAGNIVVCHRILQSTQKVHSLRAGGRGAILLATRVQEPSATRV